MATTLTFLYTLEGRGWARAFLSDGDNEISVTVSYLSDTLSELLWAVISLLEGEEQGRSLWEEEPGEYRWLFLRQEEQLKIRILWFEEEFSHQKDEDGRVCMEIECSLVKFATKFNRQLNQLLVTWGLEGYQRTWGHVFPQKEHERLKCLLRVRSHLSNF